MKISNVSHHKNDIRKAKILDEATAIVDGGDVEQFISQRCDGDSELADEIFLLYKAFQSNSSFLESSHTKKFNLPAVDVSDSDFSPGAVIEPYELIDKIGEGGMGTVWRARHVQQNRIVAIKFIRTRFAYSATIANFEREIQTLAQLDHQNIAKILDSGVTASGAPWFAMDYVERQKPITHYCREHQLGIAQRLQLMIDLCNAVQHAHHRRVLHLDLKPANVLVQRVGGRDEPKIIDFGLAAVIEDHTQNDEDRFITRTSVGGTLHYMAPEQADLNSPNLGGEADIYSLGVILYELLVDASPIGKELLDENKLAESFEARRLMNQPVTPPSEELKKSKEPQEICESRRISLKRYGNMLSKDLDWIAGKALQFACADRYATAASMAEDIQRFQDGRPVLARVEQNPRQSRLYIAQKAIQRNYMLVSAACLVFLLLIGAVAGTSFGLLRARESASQARQTKEHYRKALDIYASSFISIDPHFGGQADLTALDVLEQAKAQLNDADLDLEGKAQLLSALATSFVGLGNFESAIAALTEVAEIQAKRFEPEHIRTLASEVALAEIYRKSGQIDTAIDLLEKSFMKLENTVGTQNVDAIVCQSSLAEAYREKGRFKESINLQKVALESATRNLGLAHGTTISSMSNLAKAYLSAGQTDEAIVMQHKSFDACVDLYGPDHTETLTSMENLATMYLPAEKYAQASNLYGKILKKRARSLNEAHPNVIINRSNLGFALTRMGNFDEAIPLLEETVSTAEAKRGADPVTLTAMHNLADAYLKHGQLEEATKLYEKTVTLRKSKLGRSHIDTLASENNLAAAYRLNRELEKAIELYQQVLAARQIVLPADHPDTLLTTSDLAETYWVSKQHEKAIALMREVVDLRSAKFGRNDSRTLRAVANLGVVLIDSGKMDQGISHLEEACNGPTEIKHLWAYRSRLRKAYLENNQLVQFRQMAMSDLDRQRKEQPADSANYAITIFLIGRDFYSIGDFAEAEMILNESFEILHQKAPLNWVTFRTQSLLGSVIAKQEKLDSAAVHLKAGYDGLKQSATSIPAALRKTVLAAAIQRLIDFSQSTDNATDLERWKTELEKLDPGS